MKLLSVILGTVLLLSSGCATSRVQSTNQNIGTESVGAPEKEIVKVTAAGFVPASIHLKQHDGSVFFLNATQDSLITLSVNFGKHRPHCASANMVYDQTGKLKSKAPIGPKDFALMCFPEKGTYQVTAYGVSGQTKTGTVIAE